MVLFSLLLALGIIVDDAIVVIENTHRIFHQNHDLSIAQAAKYAAGEVFLPVLAGTLTTLAPFFPLLFWPGIIGKFMKNLPITLMITLGASLFVAFVINPVFAASFMNKDDKEKSVLRNYIPWFIFFGSVAILSYIFKSFGIGNFAIFAIILMLLYHFFFDAATRWHGRKIYGHDLSMSYRSTLKVFIKGSGPLIVPIVAFLLLILSGIVLALTKPVVELFPSGEPNFVYVYSKLPMGTDANVTDSITQNIEKRVYKVIGEHNVDVTSVITNVGLGAGDPQNPTKWPPRINQRSQSPSKNMLTVKTLIHLNGLMPSEMNLRRGSRSTNIC
jgi:multidrug efflux pump subunit AcrB